MSEFIFCLFGVVLGMLFTTPFAIYPSQIEKGNPVRVFDKQYDCREVARKDWVKVEYVTISSKIDFYDDFCKACNLENHRLEHTCEKRVR